MNKLKQLRLEKGLSQREVSLFLGYTTSQHVSNNENNKSYYSPKHFNKLANLYEISIDDILKDYKKYKLEKLNKKYSRIKNNALSVKTKDGFKMKPRKPKIEKGHFIKCGHIADINNTFIDKKNIAHCRMCRTIERNSNRNKTK